MYQLMLYINFYCYRGVKKSYFLVHVIGQGTTRSVTNWEMFYWCSAFLLAVRCYILFILSAGLVYGKIPSGPQKVDHSSSSGWLMLFTQNEIVLSQRKFVFVFFSLFTPEELHWVLSVLGSLTRIKRIVWSFHRVVWVGRRIKQAPFTCCCCCCCRCCWCRT